MAEQTRVRFDKLEQQDGSLVAVWGFRGGCTQSLVREYMAAVYSIPENGIRLKSGVNYEFRLFMLAAHTPIKFHMNLFHQPKLAPILPAAAGYQFFSKTNDAAIFRIRRVIELIRNFEVDLDLSRFGEWVSIFPDAVSFGDDMPATPAEV